MILKIQVPWLDSVVWLFSQHGKIVFLKIIVHSHMLGFTLFLVNKPNTILRRQDFQKQLHKFLRPLSGNKSWPDFSSSCLVLF